MSTVLRICNRCNSNKTRVKSNGQELWYKDKTNGLSLCNRCYTKEYTVEHPEYRIRWDIYKKTSKLYKRKKRLTDKIYKQSTKGKVSTKRYNHKIKWRLISILGDGSCSKCGLFDLRFLQFDHINGRGIDDHKMFNRQQKIYLFYLKNPELARQKLQILCANCNWIKRYQNQELKRFSS